MNGFNTFLKKELIEFIKTWKFLIMLALFLASSLMAPVLTYFMPQFIEMSKQAGMDLTNYMNSVSDPFIYYFTYQIQMGFLALIFIICISVVSEKTKGTAVLTLTKNMTRKSFILAKFVSYCFWYTIIYVISYLVFLIFSLILLDNYFTAEAFIAALLFYILGLLFISCSVFASSISKKTLGAALISFAFYALVIILSSIPYINKFTPGMLIEASYTYVSAGYDIKYLIIPLLVTFASIILTVIGGIVVFERQEL